VNLKFQLDDLRVFCLAARKASFAATAMELGTSPAFVSKRIADPREGAWRYAIPPCCSARHGD
jgi:hypothetical protein